MKHNQTGFLFLVLESIIRSHFALKHPIALLFYGFVITTVSMAISLATFPNYASLLTIAFITIGCLPILHRIYYHEEKAELREHGNPATFLERHFHLIQVFMFLFIGITLAYSFWYLNLSTEHRTDVFEEQENNWKRIDALRGNATGILPSGACQSNDLFTLAFNCIFANNALVLAWSLLLALLYGAGAIFSIAWNASVIGLVLAKETALNGLQNGLMRAIGLIPHGGLEIGGYFLGAIAGGLVSIAVATKSYTKPHFRTMVQDIVFLVILAYLLLVLGALLEAHLIISSP